MPKIRVNVLECSISSGTSKRTGKDWAMRKANSLVHVRNFDRQETALVQLTVPDGQTVEPGRVYDVECAIRVAGDYGDLQLVPVTFAIAADQKWVSAETVKPTGK